MEYTVSAIIPAYNAGQYICRAIDSVLAQTHPVAEIIVVDDGSTDDTAAKVRSYGNKVRLVSKPNGGEASARNAGIQAAGSEWVSFLDADDFWLPNKIQSLLDILKANPDIRWGFGNCYTVSQTDKRKALLISETEYARYLSGSNIISDPLAMYFKGFRMNSNTGIFHKTVFETVGEFKKYRRGTDVDMWFRIFFHFPSAVFSFEPVSEYIIDTEGNATSTWPEKGFYIIWLSSLLEDADKAGVKDIYIKYLPDLIYKRLRAMLFHSERAEEGIEILTYFKEYLPAVKRKTYHFAFSYPWLSQFVMRTVSILVRKSKFRKKVVRKNY